MYGCENWTIKKAEHQRIDALELWCWRFLRVPWTARRSSQSILKEINPEYSLEGLMLKLKLKPQYFGHLMWRTDSLEKTLMLDSVLTSRDITLLTKVCVVKAMFLFLFFKESWVPKNWSFWTVVMENSWKSLGLQGDPTSPSSRKSVLNIHWKDWCWCWSWSSNTLATWCEELTHWKRPWC